MTITQCKEHYGKQRDRESKGIPDGGDEDRYPSPFLLQFSRKIILPIPRLHLFRKQFRRHPSTSILRRSLQSKINRHPHRHMHMQIRFQLIESAISTSKEPKPNEAKKSSKDCMCVTACAGRYLEGAIGQNVRTNIDNNNSEVF